MAQVKKIKTINSLNPKKPSSTDLESQVDELRRLVEENLRYSKNTNDSVKLTSQASLEKLLKQNLKISQELLENSKKLRRWVAWQRAWGVVKVLIIAIPIILGIIYLPPLIKDLVAPFQDLLNIGVSGDSSLLQDITNQFNGSSE